MSILQLKLSGIVIYKINAIFFQWKNIAAFSEYVCILHELKSETLNFARYLGLSVNLFIHLFSRNLGVWNLNLSDNILSVRARILV